MKENDKGVILRIDRLGPQHDRESFSCGVRELDGYFRNYASQDVKKHAAACFVLLIDDEVGGYYTLSSFSIHLQKIPENLAKKFPRYPNVPATLLGRLAVDEKFRGKGIGKYLLIDALKRSLQQSKEIASSVVVVEAKDDNAASFYQSFGFLEFPDDKQRLFMQMAKIKKAFFGEFEVI